MVQSFSKIPGPLKLPFFGNLLHYKLGNYKISEYHKVLELLHKKYGPIIKDQLGFSPPVVHLFDPDDVQVVYNEEGQTPFIEPLQDAVLLYRQKNMLSLGLGNINGDEWYRLRAAVKDKVLVPKQVQNYLPIISDVTDQLIERIKKRPNEVENLRLLLAKWNREVSGWVCFGKLLNSFGKGEAVANQLYWANRTSFQMTALLKFSMSLHKLWPTAAWKRFLECEDLIYKDASEQFKEAFEKFERGDKSSQFLSHILSNKDLLVSDAAILSFSFFLDGLSTTVPIAICNLHCLGANPEIQNEVYEEIKAAVGESAEFSPESLNKLRLLKACVKETFRFYPIGTDVSRILIRNVVLSGYQIPKGTHVSLNQFVHFKSEKYFDKPNEFWPYRWLDGRSTKKVHNYLLLPFSHGPRTCAGRRLAEQDLYLCLAKLLLNFRLKATSPLEQIYETLLFPREPYNITFIPR